MKKFLFLALSLVSVRFLSEQLQSKTHQPLTCSSSSDEVGDSSSTCLEDFSHKLQPHQEGFRVFALECLIPFVNKRIKRQIELNCFENRDGASERNVCNGYVIAGDILLFKALQVFFENTNRHVNSLQTLFGTRIVKEHGTNGISCDSGIEKGTIEAEPMIHDRTMLSVRRI